MSGKQFKIRYCLERASFWLWEYSWLFYSSPGPRKCYIYLLAEHIQTFFIMQKIIIMALFKNANYEIYNLVEFGGKWSKDIPWFRYDFVSFGSHRRLLFASFVPGASCGSFLSLFRFDSFVSLFRVSIHQETHSNQKPQRLIYNRISLYGTTEINQKHFRLSWTAVIYNDFDPDCDLILFRWVTRWCPAISIFILILTLKLRVPVQMISKLPKTQQRARGEENKLCLVSLPYMVRYLR